MRGLIVLTVILLLAACAAHQIVQQAHVYYMLPKNIADDDEICIPPDKGSLFSQCLTGARFRGEANSIKAN